MNKYQDKIQFVLERPGYRTSADGVPFLNTLWENMCIRFVDTVYGDSERRCTRYSIEVYLRYLYHMGCSFNIWKNTGITESDTERIREKVILYAYNAVNWGESDTTRFFRDFCLSASIFIIFTVVLAYLGIPLRV